MRQLRRRVVAISLTCLVLVWGIIAIQMAGGDDPVLGGGESTSATGASTEWVEPESEWAEPELEWAEPESVEPAPLTTGQS